MEATRTTEIHTHTAADGDSFARTVTTCSCGVEVYPAGFGTTGRRIYRHVDTDRTFCAAR